MTYFPVAERGTGRRDYSNAIEFLTAATWKGRQLRTNWTGYWADLPTLIYPMSYFVHFPFYDADRNLVNEAPDVPYQIQNVVISSERNALVFVAFLQFASYYDLTIWNIEKHLGYLFGYNEVALNFTCGIRTIEGKAFAALFAEYSEKATCDVYLTANALYEEVVYGD